MNAAIRAVARTSIDKGWEVFGVQHGYAGLIDDAMIPLGVRDVGGIIGRGGTMLGSARSPEFRTEEGRMQALRSLHERAIDALVVIGGNGSQAGAYALSQMGFPVVGVASTIDNDLVGSDVCIGVDTALNIALEAVDRLKTTASSHGVSSTWPHRQPMHAVPRSSIGWLTMKMPPCAATSSAMPCTVRFA